MVGRVVHTADFERALATRPRNRSAHFALHHVSETTGSAVPPGDSAEPVDLSTGPGRDGPETVDNSPASSPPDVRLGCVVGKRFARRSVTRNLIRRQIRAAFLRHRLPAGIWVVRLRAPLARDQFRSAASDALRSAVRTELDGLLARVAG